MRKYVNLVDLVKSFQTSIYLKNRRGYSREGASLNFLEMIHFIYSFASLLVKQSAQVEAPGTRSSGSDVLLRRREWPVNLLDKPGEAETSCSSSSASQRMQASDFFT